MVILHRSYPGNISQKYSSVENTPLQAHKAKNYESDGKGVSESAKSNTFKEMDAEFFQSLNDFKSDFLFTKTESILAKPSNVYRQVNTPANITNFPFLDLRC